MSKSLWIVLGIIVIALLGLFVYMNVFNKPADNTKTNNNTTTNNDNTGTDTNPIQNTVNTNSVSIKDEAFSPSAITVKAGTTVTWTNNDPFAHAVAFEDSTIGSSPIIEAGKTFSVKFTKAGTYNYNCTIHTFMTGIVVVE